MPRAEKRLDKVWTVVYCKQTKQYLLGRRSGKVNNSGQWNFFGGNVDEGEDLEKAAKRELFEEAGIKVSAVKKVFQKKARTETITFFKAEVESPIALKANKENDSWGWFSFKALKELKLHRYTRLYYNTVIKSKKK